MRVDDGSRVAVQCGVCVAPTVAVAKLRSVNMSFVVRHIFVSQGHNYFGRYGQVAGKHAMSDVPEVTCRAGWGLEGDRFYGYRPGYRGQVTFFAWETFQAAKRKFKLPSLSPDVFRRNVITEGVDLNSLVGRRFTLDGVEFEGIEESRPCHWMNSAVAPGAEDWLRGQGGLRAKVLSDGRLAVGPFELRLFQEVA
jgi:MOSC domain-containing protein YiiM